MPTIVLAAREADITDDADDSTAGNQNIEAALPNPVEVVEELGVVVDVTELPVGVAMFSKDFNVQ